MKVYCIRKYYRAVDTWYKDEDIFFTEEWLCRERLKHLQKKYAEDYEREDCDFTGYEVIEKNITFVDDTMHLEMIQSQEDFNYEAIKNWTPEED